MKEQLKAEREIKTRKLAKDERNIIVSNVDGIKKVNKGQLIEKIKEFVSDWCVFLDNNLDLE